MIFIFIFVSVTLNVGNSDPLTTVQNPIIILQYFDWPNIIPFKEWYSVYPENIIRNKEKICESLTRAKVVKISGDYVDSYSIMLEGVEIERELTSRHTVQVQITHTLDLDLIPCKYQSAWIYFAGAENFNGFILLINHPGSTNVPAKFHFIGFLTEPNSYKWIVNAKEEFQNVFQHFPELPDTVFYIDEANRSVKFGLTYETYLQCASVHYSISVRQFSMVEIKVSQVLINLSYQIFEKSSGETSSNITVWTLQCETPRYKYNLFVHPTNHLRMFVMYYDCTNKAQGFVVFETAN